jgi:small subunit ribosomal protein S8e
MVQWQTESKRKRTGGIRRSIRARDKKLSERGGNIAETKIGAEKRLSLTSRGNTRKVKLLQSREANIVGEKGSMLKSEIVTVKGNAANKLFVRRNIMTKGAIIEVKYKAENRLAKITNRPGQSGTIEAVLLPLEAAEQFKKVQSAESVKTSQKAKETQNKSKEQEKTTN